jgi:hypothetical protein
MAAMTWSSAVIVGFVNYLCLKKAVPEMLGHKLWGSKIANSGSVQWTCPEQMLWCSFQRRCDIYGACSEPELPSQWGQRDDNCSRVVHRRAHTLISLDVLVIAEEGEAGV